MRFDTVQFLTSITGVTSVLGSSLLLSRQYKLASAVFTFLTIGSMGVLWERYSRKNESPLDLKVLMKKRLPDKEDLEFILTHSPYVVLAVLTGFLAKTVNKTVQ